MADSYLVGATAFCDVNGGLRAVRDAVVHIRGDTIERVGRREEVPLPDGAGVLDLTGFFLTPGLCDVRVHYSQSCWVDTHQHALGAGAATSNEEAAEALRRMRGTVAQTDLALLSCGVTAALDAGGPPWTLELAGRSRDVGSFDMRELPLAPTVLACGPALSCAAHAALPSSAADDDPAHNWASSSAAAMLNVRTRGGAERAVRALCERGCAFVSFVLPELADGTVPRQTSDGGANAADGSARNAAHRAPGSGDAELAGPVAAAELLRTVADAASAAGVPLAVTSARLSGAQLGARAGATLLLHGVDDEQLDEALLVALRASADGLGAPAGGARRAPAYCAALSLSHAAERLFRRRAPVGAERPQQPGPTGARTAALASLLAALPPNPRGRATLAAPFAARFAAQRHTAALNVLRLHMAGVPIVVGTGAGAPLQVHGAAIFDEMEALQQAGLRPLEVLRAASVNGHAALGLGETRGTLGAGMRADLVVLRDDPSDDIGNMRSIMLVLKDGCVAWARPGSRLEGVRLGGAPVTPG